MWDFPNDLNVQRISREMYENGGIVAAVCHGPIALAKVRLSNGDLLIAGKRVTAFSNDEEDQCDISVHLPAHDDVGGLKTPGDILAAVGGVYSAASAWSSHHCVDGRLITGQNPASARATAEAIVALLSVAA